MTTKIEFTFEDDEQDRMVAYSNARERDAFLFELFNNFFRKYKHRDDEPTLEEIKTDLWELKNEYRVVMSE